VTKDVIHSDHESHFAFARQEFCPMLGIGWRFRLEPPGRVRDWELSREGRGTTTTRGGTTSPTFDCRDCGFGHVGTETAGLQVAQSSSSDEARRPHKILTTRQNRKESSGPINLGGPLPLKPGSARRRTSSDPRCGAAGWSCGSAGRAGPRGRRPDAGPGSRPPRRTGRGTARRPASSRGA
jgi:hypothetical protein